MHDFIVMSDASSEHYPVAVHEYTHLMIHQSGMEIPAWLNEGLAELYSSLEPRGVKILVGQVIPGRLQALRSDRWIPLAALLAVDHASPLYNEKSRAGMFYAESWALVHMLNLDPAYRPQLKSLVAALKENDPPAAFARAYGKQVGEVEAALRTYFNSPTVHAQLFDVNVPKSVEAPEIEPAASFPARLALAELLANYRGRGDQARAAYDQLAKDYPDRWEVEEGLGQFAWQDRKLAEAARHFARAMELGCNNLPSLLLYARVLGYNNQPKDEVGVLLKAAKLFPESARAVTRAKGRPAVIVYTLVKPEWRVAMRSLCRSARVHYCDLLGHPIDSVRRVSGVAARMTPGARAALDENYFKRMEAIEFAVKYDDGIGTRALDEADVILVGVSRTSKTPLSIYLGYLGHKVANVPIVKGIEPPPELFKAPPEKIVGLTIDAERLAEIRHVRARAMGASKRVRGAARGLR